MDEEGSHDLLESNTDVVLVEKPTEGQRVVVVDVALHSENG